MGRPLAIVDNQRNRLNQRLVRKGGLEPPRYCYRQPLKLVRLPIPPLPRDFSNPKSEIRSEIYGVLFPEGGVSGAAGVGVAFAGAGTAAGAGAGPSMPPTTELVPRVRHTVSVSAKITNN